MSSSGEAQDTRAWHAVADLYHAYFTGQIMLLVTRRGTAEATEFVFRVFRRQHHERFLAGLEKFGLTGTPHAVAAAQYHYLSNKIGGVHVESDRKAWIRYPPPRWIWRGTAICAIPSEVSAAMLRGWHAHNGVSLKNPRLGFVCTKQTVDGQNGLEGFYYEYDRDLAEHERLTFAHDLDAPLFDLTKAPALASDTWPKARLEKAYRNYAIEYVRSALPVTVDLFGADEAGALLRLNGKLIGMQMADDVFAALPVRDKTAAGFANWLVSFLAAQGDEADANGATVTQKTWSLIARDDDMHPAWTEALAGMIEGLMMAYERRLALDFERPQNANGPLRWSIRERKLVASDGRFPA